MSQTKTKVTVNKKTKRQWAAAATKVVGNTPRELGKSKIETHMKRVWVGIFRENCPEVCLKEIADFADLDVAHSTVHLLFEGWKGMPWRVRHGWLMMAEAAINSRADWLPAVWHQEVHELAVASLGDDSVFTEWNHSLHRFRRPSMTGGGRERIR